MCIFALSAGAARSAPPSGARRLVPGLTNGCEGECRRKAELRVRDAYACEAKCPESAVDGRVQAWLSGDSERTEHADSVQHPSLIRQPDGRASSPSRRTRYRIEGSQ